MKVAAYHRYGPPEVLTFEDRPVPVPKENEILIRVHATTVTAGDYRMRGLNIPSRLFKVLGRLFLGITGPRNTVLGTEIAGVVESVGGKVTRFQPGDRVVAFTGARGGGYGEFLTIAESSPVTQVPASLTLKEAVSLPFGFSTAWYFLQEVANVGPGNRVLINGASGNVGTFSIQVAKHLGAEVHGVCSRQNVELVTGLGAQRVFDYTSEDFRKSDERYDVIFDTIGNLNFAQCKNSLKDKGQFLAAVLSSRELLQMATTAFLGSKQVKGGVAPETLEHLELALKLAESGVIRPVIGREFPFAEIVEAHRFADTGRKVGSIVISLMSEENESL